MAKRKQAKGKNNDLQNITHKTKDRAKPGAELMCFGRVSSSCSSSDKRRLTLVTNPVISHE